MHRKHKLIITFIGASLTLFASIVTTRGIKDAAFLSRISADTSYSIELNSNNKFISSNSTSTIFTRDGNSVKFSYSNCSEYANGHVIINENGTLKNDQQITSITSLFPSFITTSNSSLSFRASFDGKKWGEYTTLTSNKSFDLPSKPYFIELKAIGGSISLNSLTYTFSCEANPDAKAGESNPIFTKLTSAQTDYSGKYLLVYEEGGKAFDSSLSTVDAEGNYVSVTVNKTKNTIAYTKDLENIVVTLNKVTNGYTVKAANGKYLDKSSYGNGLSATTTAGINTITLNGTVPYIMGSGGVTFCFNSASTNGNRFRYYKSPSATIVIASMFKLEGLEQTVGTPSYEVGLTVEDSKKLEYTINDTFDNFVENGGLSVTAMMSDGTSKKISKSDYSYTVSYDGNLIDSSKAFQNIGEHEVTISYKGLIPTKYTINVLNVASSIEASKIKTSYSVGDNIDLTDITAVISYSNGTKSSSITYGNFASNNLAVELKNPSSTVVNSGTFNIAGNWSAKVYITSNPSIYSNIAISVNAVQVTGITLDKSTLELATGATGSLIATVLPENATDKTVIWTTSNNSVATVSNGAISALKAGTSTIKAKASTFEASCVVTVKDIAVTSVSISMTELAVTVGKTETLSATIYPSNATNKNVSYSSNNISVATVNNNGVVTGVSEGSATITVTTEDGGKTATCSVTVEKASQVSGTLTITSDDLSTSYSSSGTITVKDSNNNSYTLNTCNVANFGNGVQFKASSGYISNTSGLTIQSIELVTKSGKVFSGTLYWGASANPSTNGVSVSNGGTYTNSGSYSYFKLLKNTSNSGYLDKIIITLGVTKPVNPTEINIPSTATVGVGSTTTLTVSYSPSNCNQNKDVTWSSNATSIAKVDSSTGLITGVSTGTATITATSTFDTSLKASCIVTVTEKSIDKWTILMYVCGADLESDSQLATSDFSEITSVSNQPDDVNIVIQTGGAKSWSSKYGISSSYNQRYHVSNKTLVCDNSKVYSSYTSMGLTSTLKDFLVWGIETYPAEKIGLIFWNHGGAMRGVCYDEKKNDDSLTNSEIKSAVSSAFTTLGRTEKLEFIGYDACLMQVQDIAEFNSNYFNYMVGSEESEAGEGWDYDNWIDDLYAKKDTTVILKAICDSFISDNGGTSSTNNDQTLSYLNLSYASQYKEAWENMTTALTSKLGSTSAKTFASWILKKVKHFGDTDYNYFHVFDAKDFVNELANDSTYNPGSTYTSAVLTAFSNFVAYSTCGKGAGDSYGLCMVYVYTQDRSYGLINDYYTTSQTNFTKWRSFNRTYGDLD